jgi:serine/threonine protein kinase
MACLDEETLLAFAGGTLGESERQIAEAHIDRCASCRWLLARLALDADSSKTSQRRAGRGMTSSAATTAADPPSGAGAPVLSPGTVIDEVYVIQSQIGCGGMGSVYLATDRRLQRPVALKMINRDLLGSTDLVDRFIFEARVTAQFSHPNIISVYGAGEFEGRPYLVLEYVPGETLRHRMLAEPPTVAETIEIARSLARALAEAHDNLVLHRDLKPGNVMVGPGGRVMVLDFGLARLLEVQPVDLGDAEQRSTLAGMHRTRTEGFKGTPRYMAPEQWRGETVTRATDIWAFGVILFELTFGRHPFDDQDHDPEALSKRVISPEPATVPQVRRPHNDLRQIISACLEKDPSSRPSADQLVQRLERAPRPGRLGRLMKPRYLGVLLVVPLLVLIGVLAGTRFNGPDLDARPPRDAERPTLLARSPDAGGSPPARSQPAPTKSKRGKMTRRATTRSRRRFGRINIQALDGGEPRPVVVVMDGKVVGETPLQLFKVPVGTHYLTIRHDAYRVMRRRVRLRRGEQRTVLFRLQRRPNTRP